MSGWPSGWSGGRYFDRPDFDSRIFDLKMSTLGSGTLARPAAFYQDSIGKKLVMAVTGLILFGFVLGHLAGNLQVYLGPEVFNAYALFLRQTPALLWGTRAIVLVAVVLHVWSAVRLAGLKRDARPVAYTRWTSRDTSYSARTMMWSGPILAAFLVYHLLHLTLGTVHPDFDHENVYGNFIIGFRSLPVVAAYAVSMVMLGMHLGHGIWSMFQTVGFSHPVWTPRLRTGARLLAALIVLGYISMPVAVLTGVLR
jgi:succinate dehydrogenase / fumarate reductase cytochrome b subunit